MSIFLVDSYGESNYNNVYSVNLDRIEVAQSFTGSAGNLTSAKFYIRKVGSPTGNAVARLYPQVGVYGKSSRPDNVVLATSDTIDVSTLSENLELITFNFTGAEQYTLLEGLHYCIALVYTGGISDYLEVAYDDSSPTHDGN